MAVPPEVFEEDVDVLNGEGGRSISGGVQRWRARLRTNNPLLPVTPWFSLAGNGHTEAKLRTGKRVEEDEPQ